MKTHAFVGILFVATVALADTPGTTRVFKVDAVELVSGKETPGKSEFSVKHGRYEYHFSSPANRDAFLKSPETFEIQLGGACARMGPLSGGCSSELFGVFEGRIYVFASEQCKKRFMAGPKELLETPDAPASGNAASIQRGGELVELALKGFGGAKVVDQLTSFRAEKTATSKHGDKDYTNRKAWTARFPDEFRMDDDWNESRWAAVAMKGDAFFAADEVWTMHPQQRAAVEREFAHEPLVILRARTRPDFVAAAAGKGRVQDRPVEFVAVSFGGVTTKLGVDTETGRVLSTAFRGRGPAMALGDVERIYGDFQSTGGVDVPTSFRARFNGADEPKLDVQFDRVALNAELDATLFARPNP